MTCNVAVPVLLSVLASAWGGPAPAPAPAPLPAPYRPRNYDPVDSKEAATSDLQFLVPLVVVGERSEELGAGAGAGGRAAAKASKASGGGGGQAVPNFKPRYASVETSSEEERALVEALGLLLGTINARNADSQKKVNKPRSPAANKFKPRASESDAWVNSAGSGGAGAPGLTLSSISLLPDPRDANRAEAPRALADSAERNNPRLCIVDLSGRRDLPDDDQSPVSE